jgi:hypothetical protein
LSFERDDFTRKEEDDAGCAEYDVLISKACDGECTPEEMTVLGEHMKDCEGCRATMREYREICGVMASRLVALSCPPPPVLPRKPHGSSVLAGTRLSACAAILGGMAACLLFFAAGNVIGFRQAEDRIARNLSPTAVVTPSLWAVNRPAGAISLANAESEQPFTDGISQYRSAITEELRKDSVDWLKVRDLVESMGELRTDLELLTIHMAYLDIRTGSSPSSVANHWEAIGSMSERTAFKR